MARSRNIDNMPQVTPPPFARRLITWCLSLANRVSTTCRRCISRRKLECPPLNSRSCAVAGTYASLQHSEGSTRSVPASRHCLSAPRSERESLLNFWRWTVHFRRPERARNEGSRRLIRLNALSECLWIDALPECDCERYLL